MKNLNVDLIDDVDNEAAEQDLDVDFELEKKYAQQMRQIHPQKIELPISMLKTMIEEQISLSPDFQRRDRWDAKKQSRFIESIIMNVPVPPVFLGEDKYGQYVVLDGRQRLTAVYEFLRGGYSLENLEVWKELNNLRYSDLEDRGLAPTLKRRFIPAVLLLRETSPEVKYDVFDRLNTGGVPLNSMEIRNAVFPGKYNRLLHTLSDDTTFRELWEIPQNNLERKKNGLYANMKDVELVLRFLALRSPEKIRKSFKWWLGHYLGEMNEMSENNPNVLAEDTSAFERAVKSIKIVFGLEHAFVRPDDLKRGIKSAPLADALMVAFAELEPLKLTEEISEKLRSGLLNLMKDPTFIKSITTGTNGKGAIFQRVSCVKALVVNVANEALI